MIHILVDSLRNAILISGLVVVMMMLIESLNIESRGGLFGGLRKSRIGQVIMGALLGSVPGCMGGFAVVSLYTHGLMTFGALVAMMIATAGDESFVMLAMMPSDAVWIFALLFAVAVAAGILVDIFYKKRPGVKCEQEFTVHEEDKEDAHEHGRHFGWKRIVMFVGVAIFIAALAGGMLEHDHEHSHEAAAVESCEHSHCSDQHCQECGHEHHQACAHEHHHHGHADNAKSGGINLLDEQWMNVMFAVLSVIILVVLCVASDHFVDEHLWHHIICRHLPRIFAWTLGVLLVLGVLMNYVDVSKWIGENTVLMILLATAIGFIPESGPHLLFVTLYASGVLPLPVLLASCVSQDGHAALPLLAESKADFFKAKSINAVLALVVGFVAMIFV